MLTEQLCSQDRNIQQLQQLLELVLCAWELHESVQGARPPQA